MSEQDELIRLAESRGGKVMGVNRNLTAFYLCGCQSFDQAPPDKCAKHDSFFAWKQAPTAKKKSKYGTIPTLYNGLNYASKAEANRAKELDCDLGLGEIRGWTRQVRFYLGDPDTKYVVDFLVFGWDEIWAEDVKGKSTAKFLADVKRWRRYGPCDLRIIKGGKISETIPGKRP